MIDRLSRFWTRNLPEELYCSLDTAEGENKGMSVIKIIFVQTGYLTRSLHFLRSRLLIPQQLPLTLPQTSPVMETNVFNHPIHVRGRVTTQKQKATSQRSGLPTKPLLKEIDIAPLAPTPTDLPYFISKPPRPTDRHRHCADLLIPCLLPD